MEPGSNATTWPTVTTILLVREPRGWEVETAQMLRAQEYPGQAFVHAVDSSPDPTAPNNQVIKDLCDHWVSVDPKSFHHSRTRNDAVVHVHTPITVFLSSDAHPVGSDWLRALVAPLMSGDADLSYGRQRPPTPDGEREATYGYLYPDEPQIKTLDTIAELGFRGLHFSDVSSAYLTDVLRDIPFPPDISIFQDAAIAKLMLDAGKRIAYVPDAEVLHAHPMTWRYMWSRYRGLGEVYERLGMFDVLATKGRRSLTAEGLSAVRHMIPRTGAHPIAAARAVAIGTVKAAATAKGRRDARKHPPQSLEWTPEQGSRGVRR